MKTQVCNLLYGELEAPAGDHITNAYAQGHYYEQSMLDYIRRNKSRGLTFVDVGAFVGGHTMFFARGCSAKAVYAFEPNPVAFELLESNTQYLDNVKVFCTALGSRTRRGEIVAGNKGNAGSTSVREKARGPIGIKTLDGVLKSEDSPHIHILKIDAEGMGLEVLKGARKTIDRCNPSIFVEIGPDDDDAGIRAFMAENAYEQVERFNATPTFYFRPMR